MAANVVSDLDGKAPESTDFANYFCTYAYLYHQKDMLEDHKRTGAYHEAILNNRRCFEGKVVLDVGTGSGILAMFAAQAGAKKVYAVEATDMAKFAKKLVAHNKFGDVIEVIQGTIETVSLPEKVDIIVSEWMGYFLMRESMLDSVLVARDRFLKEGGALYPSHARIFLAPIRTQLTDQRAAEFQRSLHDWGGFVADMRAYYDVDLSCVTPDFETEQQEYCVQTAQWTDVHPGNLLGQSAVLQEYDLATVTIDEIKQPMRAAFKMQVTRPGPIQGFVGYFDTSFKGSIQNPTDVEVVLTTAPDATGATHWGQMTFQVSPPIMATAGDVIECTMEMHRRQENQRLMNIKMTAHCVGPSEFAAREQPRTLLYKID